MANCCFNHVVGLPTKNKREFRLFDYEKILYDSLMQPSPEPELSKTNISGVKKATGLGVTEFMLRLMAWLCTSTDDYKNTQMCIVTGPNIDLAIKLIKRLKAIFSNRLGVYFTNKETVLRVERLHDTGVSK